MRDSKYTVTGIIKPRARNVRNPRKKKGSGTLLLSLKNTVLRATSAISVLCMTGEVGPTFSTIRGISQILRNLDQISLVTGSEIHYWQASCHMVVIASAFFTVLFLKVAKILAGKKVAHPLFFKALCLISTWQATELENSQYI